MDITLNLGATLPNGTTLIAITEIAPNEAIVMALTNGRSGHAYATWAMRLDDNMCFGGDYSNTLSEAYESYTARGGK